MSSSANRRPRVAGQRRRPDRVGETSLGADLDVGDATTADARTLDETITDETTDATTTDPVPKETAPGETATGEAEDAADGVEDSVATPVSRRALLVSATALALSLALLATLLLVTREDPAQRSRDASAASATARSTLEQILSYNAETMTQQIPANQALLTGKFKDEFAATMTKTIVPLATKDKTVVKARAYEVGVMSQDDDTVTVQAFVDQARTSDVQKQPSIDQNRVIATMTRVGNRWLVSSLKAY